MRQTAFRRLGSSAKPQCGPWLRLPALKSLLPDKQLRVKARRGPTCPLPTLPAQVALTVSPGNYLCRLESPGGWEGNPCLTHILVSPLPTLTSAPPQARLRKPLQSAGKPTSFSLPPGPQGKHTCPPTASLRLNWYLNRPTIFLRRVLSLPRAPFLFRGAVPPPLYILDAAELLRCA